eukprot:Ihof_evm4s172 gene=Ihof_evmTU4s172
MSRFAVDNNSEEDIISRESHDNDDHRIMAETLSNIEIRSDGSPTSSSLSDISDLSNPKGMEPLYPTKPKADSFMAEVRNNASKAKNVTTRWIKNEFKGYGVFEWAALFLPCLTWLRVYQFKNYFIKDMIAGLSVGLLLIPQSMSYASLAGLPFEYGLYGAFVPVVFYLLGGSCLQLAVGPVAIVSLMLSASIRDIVDYNMVAIQVTLLVGVLQFAMGLFRLGFLTNFLSHSVISGFTTGSAITIIMQQVKDIMGINAQRGAELQHVVKNLIDNINTFSWRTFLFSLGCLTILISFKQISVRCSRLNLLGALGPITVTAGSIILSRTLHFDEHGIDTIGPFPGGLPRPTFAWWSFSAKYPIGSIIGSAALIALVGVMESISIAKVMAEKNHFSYSPDQDLRTIGMGNIIGSGFSAYVATGSFSRTSLANTTGAKTQLQGLATSLLILLVMAAITKPFFYLPKAAMGCIIAVSVSGLVDTAEAIHTWKVSKKDFLVWLTSCLVTVFAGAALGLGVSLGIHILLTIIESAFPYTSVLGRVPGTTIYRDIKRYKAALIIPGILVFRVDAPIYFANVQYISERITKLVTREEGIRNEKIQYLIIDMQPVTHVDATAIRQLFSTIASLKYRGIRVVLGGTTKNTLRLLVRGGLLEVIGHEWMFMQVYEAVLTCVKTMQDTAAPTIISNNNDMGSNINGSNMHILQETVEAPFPIQLEKKHELHTTYEPNTGSSDLVAVKTTSDDTNDIGSNERLNNR